MVKTRLTTLVVLALIAAFIVFWGLVFLTRRGFLLPLIPITFPITLLVVSGALLALAIPIKRAMNQKSQRRVNSFYAIRVLALAKASSLCGAILSGVHAGVVFYMLSREVVPNSTLIAHNVFTFFCSLVLVVSGLVAEWLCRLPKDDQDKDFYPVEQGPSAEPT